MSVACTHKSLSTVLSDNDYTSSCLNCRMLPSAAPSECSCTCRIVFLASFAVYQLGSTCSSCAHQLECVGRHWAVLLHIFAQLEASTESSLKCCTLKDLDTRCVCCSQWGMRAAQPKCIPRSCPRHLWRRRSRKGPSCALGKCRTSPPLARRLQASPFICCSAVIGKHNWHCCCSMLQSLPNIDGLSGQCC